MGSFILECCTTCGVNAIYNPCVCLCAFRDGKIDVHEFESLWKYVQEWRNCFERYNAQSCCYSNGLPISLTSVRYLHRSAVSLLPPCVFSRYDRDRSGKIDSSELHQALTEFGYIL